jgi:hypothetical protein
MNGYLDQLANRALDLTPVLKPQLSAWFEPVIAQTAELPEGITELEVPDSGVQPLADAGIVADLLHTAVSELVPQAFTPQPVHRAAVLIGREVLEQHDSEVESRVVAAPQPVQLSNAVVPVQPLSSSNPVATSVQRGVVPISVPSPALESVDAGVTSNSTPEAGFQADPSAQPGTIDQPVMAGLIPKPMSSMHADSGPSFVRPPFFPVKGRE